MSAGERHRIYPPPRRAASWYTPRRWASSFAGGVSGGEWVIVANGVGGGVVIACAIVSTLVCIDAIVGFPTWFALFNSKRYVLWTVRCRRGRRCADLHVARDEISSRLTESTMVVRLAWRCAGCGTEYERREVVPVIAQLRTRSSSGSRS